MSSELMFPSPIGGVPLDADFAPSVLFACLYAILVFVGVYRFARSSTRTFVMLSAFAFVVERVVIFTLRAKQAKTPAQREDKNLTLYWQITFATGYISLYVTAVKALQCLVVGSTMGSVPGVQNDGPDSKSTDVESGTRTELQASGDAETALGKPVEEPDRPERRKVYRGTFIALSLQSWVAVTLGIIAGQGYVVATMDAARIASVRDMRFAANAVAFALVTAMQGLALWAAIGIPNIRRKDASLVAALLIFGVGTLLNTISVYRFAVLGDNTSALLSTAPESLNSPRDKALFYVFQAAPELVAAAVLVCVDIRRVFGTGPWGDRLWDPKRRA